MDWKAFFITFEVLFFFFSFTLTIKELVEEVDVSDVRYVEIISGYIEMIAININVVKNIFIHHILQQRNIICFILVIHKVYKRYVNYNLLSLYLYKIRYTRLTNHKSGIVGWSLSQKKRLMPYEPFKDGLRYGGRSSAGRALGCGPRCHGFESRRSPKQQIMTNENWLL